MEAYVLMRPNTVAQCIVSVQVNSGDAEDVGRKNVVGLGGTVTGGSAGGVSGSRSGGGAADETEG